jgi:hypothetical protein
MKKLFYFRHSSKDGINNTIGPKGLALARKVGDWLYDSEEELEFDRVFHGTLIRTAQTALAFTAGYGAVGDIMPVVMGLGDDAVFGEMVKPSQFRTLASSMGNFRALSQCHDASAVQKWAEGALSTVREMFDSLQADETGAAFGHSPMIELALAGILGTNDLPEEYLTFSDMEGVELQMEEDGAIKPVRKISMPAPEPAA